MTNSCDSLRQILNERSATLAPGVFDGLSAHITAQSGFRVAYMSGSAVSVATCGLPDLGLVTQTEMVHQVRLISNLLDIPLVADADTGFGDATNTFRTVQLYEQAGASAIQIEDQVFPKKCGQLDAKTVVDSAEFIEKISAAVEARRDPAMVIVARTDALAPLGFKEAIRRANMYADAGADLIFVEAPETELQVKSIPREVAAPTLFNFVPNGKTPGVPFKDLAEYGYALTILPGINIASAGVAMQRTLRAVVDETIDFSEIPSPRSRFELVGIDFWEDLRLRVAAPRQSDRV